MGKLVWAWQKGRSKGNMEIAQWTFSSLAVGNELGLLLRCFKRCKENILGVCVITFDSWGILVSKVILDRN